MGMLSRTFHMSAATRISDDRRMTETRIAETRVSAVKELQSSAKESRRKTMTHILEKFNGDSKGISSLRMREFSGREIEVLDEADYKGKFPTSKPTELGNHDPLTGNISLRETTPERIRHTSVHETTHQMSAHEVKKEGEITKVCTGLREYAFTETDEGKQKAVFDRCRATNEGVTELYTGRELKRQGDMSSLYSLNSYSEAKMHASQLELLVGKERLERAYYLGEKDELINEFNRLNESDYAWEFFNDDMEIYTYNEPSPFRASAGSRIQGTFLKMQDTKLQEMKETQNA